MEFWGKGGRPGRYRRVEVWIVEGCGEGRQGVRAGEKRGTEGGACCTRRGRPRAQRRGQGSDRGETRGSAPVQGAVFRVIQVICGERRELFRCPGLGAVVVCG